MFISKKTVQAFRTQIQKLVGESYRLSAELYQVRQETSVSPANSLVLWQGTPKQTLADRVNQLENNINRLFEYLHVTPYDPQCAKPTLRRQVKKTTRG